MAQRTRKRSRSLGTPSSNARVLADAQRAPPRARQRCRAAMRLRGRPLRARALGYLAGRPFRREWRSPMRPRTVSIDEILTELGSDMALTVDDRIALLTLGRALEKDPVRGTLKYARRHTMLRLSRRGYVKPKGSLGFEMTDRGVLRYRAELSHQEHCKGCSMCGPLRRARRP